MNYASAIEKARKYAGLTQQALAEKCELDQSYISMIINQKRVPSMKILESISKAIGVPSYCLLFLAIEDSDIDSGDKKEVFKLIRPIVEKLINIVAKEEEILDELGIEDTFGSGYDSPEVRLLSETKGGNITIEQPDESMNPSLEPFICP